MLTKKQLINDLYSLSIPVYSNRIKKEDMYAVLAHYETQGGIEIPLDFIKKVIDKFRDVLKKEPSKHPNIEKLNNFVKKETPGSLFDFANSAIEYFKKGKLKWDELGLLQDRYEPKGFEIIPWSLLKKKLEDISPEIEKQLPRAFSEQ